MDMVDTRGGDAIAVPSLRRRNHKSFTGLAHRQVWRSRAQAGFSFQV